MSTPNAEQAAVRLDEVRDFVRSTDPNIQRVFDFQVEELRAGDKNGDPNTAYAISGLAAVYNSWSLDLGGFKERILPGAFDNVLSRDPHVKHLWDHDTSKTLSSTRNKTLKLRADENGLHYYSKVAPTSYAEDLRVLLERGDIDQSSFAFTVAKDEWRIADDGDTVERDILEIQDLYDVTTTGLGAYPATDASLALRTLVNRSNVSVPTGAVVVTPGEPAGDEKEVTQGEPAGTPRTSNEDVKRELEWLKRHADEAYQTALERRLRNAGGHS